MIDEYLCEECEHPIDLQDIERQEPIRPGTKY
jgi:uncharacterized protein YlaI